MEPFAEMDCVLDVNVHCDACKMRMMEILRSIAGVYSVIIDGDNGKVRVSGDVDPNILMRALSRPGTGTHAKMNYAKVNHPRARRMNSYYDDTSYNYGSNYYNTIEDPYRYRRPPVLGGNYSYNDYSHHPHHDYYPPTTRRLLPEYNNSPYYGSSSYSYPPPLPPARYVPSYPLMENGEYDEDEPISFCSIM